LVTLVIMLYLMKLNAIGHIHNKNILFLQGPMGRFFKKLDLLFRQKGALTYQIGLNAGDALFSNADNYTAFRGKRDDWPVFFSEFIVEHNIQKVFLFGDCRAYQSQAIDAAWQLGVEIFVFEEGYIRPHFITLEKYGVNNYSRMERKREFYEALELDQLPEVHPQETHFSSANMIVSASLYYLVGNLFSFRYPHYEHHRGFSGSREAFFGVRSLYRKLLYKFTERKLLQELVLDQKKAFFFVPLQTHNDFQVLQHSDYGSIEKFIVFVIDSFARHADKAHTLLFKHHPVDRGRKDYSCFIQNQAQKYNCEERVNVVHDLHLPTILQNAKGTITINSTVGLSSIYHKTPVITLGYALYDIRGLTNKRVTLDAFWKNQVPPDMDLFKKYRRYIVFNSQLNASFYGKMPEFDSSST